MQSHQTHSLWFQWFYEVSKTVGGFAFTGLLGFVIVKKLKLQDRKVSDVPWSEFGDLSTVIVGLLAGAGFTVALIKDGNYILAALMPFIALLFGASIHYVTIKVKLWVMTRRSGG